MERVIRGDDVGVPALVDGLTPLLAGGDAQPRVVFPAQAQPLHVVGQVGAVERVLVEDAPDACDGDPRVANVSRPPKGRRELKPRAGVLVAPLEVVALAEPAGDRRAGDADERDRDHRPAPGRRSQVSTGAKPGERARRDRERDRRRNGPLRVALVPLHERRDRDRKHRREEHAHRQQAPRRPPSGREARDDRQGDGDGRRDVADVPHERDWLPLLAGGGQRREHVGEGGEQHHRPQHPQHRGAAAPDGEHPTADHQEHGHRPQATERLVQARDEPVIEHIDITEIVRDGKPGPQVKPALRRRQVDRPDRADIRDRIPGRDRIPRKPVSSTQAATAASTAAPPELASPRRARTSTPSVSAATGARNESFIPTANPAASPATARAPATIPRPGRGRGVRSADRPR